MSARLIVPLDHSNVAESALPLARGLANMLDGTVTLVGVVEAPRAFAHSTGKRDPSIDVDHQPSRSDYIAPPSPFGRWGGWTNRQPSTKQVDELAQRTSKMESYLKGTAQSFGDRHVEIVVKLGHPAEEIIDIANHRDNSVIVMASHGRGGLGRALLGSVATRVVQASSRPVFVVRGTDQASTGTGEVGLSRVLVPVDGSAFSEQALETVRKMFEGKQLKLHFVTAAHDPVFDETGKAPEYLKWLAEKVADSFADVTWEVGDGPAGRVINQVAESQNVDLIAMSTHGRSGFDRFVLGSVAERVLHEATRPLLLLPARSAGA